MIQKDTADIDMCVGMDINGTSASFLMLLHCIQSAAGQLSNHAEKNKRVSFSEVDWISRIKQYNISNAYYGSSIPCGGLWWMHDFCILTMCASYLNGLFKPNLFTVTIISFNEFKFVSIGFFKTKHVTLMHRAWEWEKNPVIYLIIYKVLWSCLQRFWSSTSETWQRTNGRANRRTNLYIPCQHCCDGDD